MPTFFIAVQCFHCSTMQVKQMKKSSNKWSCVICCEKQSVRKVFSQGFMAKDVRKFVQGFNMSRQFVEQQEELREEEDEETLGLQQIQVKKRTDWSEFIDPDINDTGIGDDQKELCEPNVVTELPKPLFKKPKLRDNYLSSVGFDGEKLKPVFRKRSFKNTINDPDKEPRTTVKENTITVRDNQLNHDNVDHTSVYQSSSSMITKIRRPNSQWNACRDDGNNVDKGFAYTGSSSVMMKLKRPASKWNDFIDDDDDYGLQLESRCQEINNAASETNISDEIVEDDIHPDFL